MVILSKRQPTEDELLAATDNGSCDAIAELFNRNLAELYRTAYRLLGNRRDAEEALHDAIGSAIALLQTYDAQADLPIRLTRITINSALQVARKRSRITGGKGRPKTDLELKVEICISDPDWERLGRIRRLGEILHRHLQDLPSEQRYVFVLHDVEEFSIAETAQMLAAPEGLVRARLCRARLQLAAQLSLYCRPASGECREVELLRAIPPRARAVHEVDRTSTEAILGGLNENIHEKISAVGPPGRNSISGRMSQKSRPSPAATASAARCAHGVAHRESQHN